MEIIKVSGSTKYDIEIERGSLCYIGEHIHNAVPEAKKILIVADENTYGLYYNTVAESLNAAELYPLCHVIKNCCEKNKGLEQVHRIYETAQANDITRNDIILALGGGIVGDISGFAAGTYMRGINFIQVPTTLVAQTDSSVGGKCGVNFGGTKNLVGMFYNPRLVYIDTDTIDTLSERQIYAGFGEIIKYACIRDREMFEMLLGDDFNIEEIIKRCVAIKRDVVEIDETDCGLRHVLNFGHTVGHALEECSNNELLHGEAVAMGMYVMALAGERLGMTVKGTSEKIKELCRKYCLSTDISAYPDFIDYIEHDKKRTGDSIKAVFLTDIGFCIIRNIKITELKGLLNG